MHLYQLFFGKFSPFGRINFQFVFKILQKSSNFLLKTFQKITMLNYTFFKQVLRILERSFFKSMIMASL
jgi:hypothetical protein